MGTEKLIQTPMSVKYISVKQHNFKDPSKPRYIAQCKSRGHVDIHDISSNLSHASTLNAADVVAVIEGLTHAISQSLSEGYIIKLGDFGSFYLSLDAEAQDTPKAVNANSIKGCKIYFRPGKQLAKKLANTTYSTR